MGRSLTAGLVSVGVLVICVGLQQWSDKPKLLEIVWDALPHIILIAEGVAMGCVLLWVFEETFSEKFAPLIAANVRDGFVSFTAGVAQEVRQFPETWKTLSSEGVLQDLTSKLKSPNVRNLVSEGKIKEAIIALDEKYLIDETKTDEEIAVLLLSDDENNWTKAEQLITTNQISKLTYFVTLAFRFWSVGKLDRAIDLSERGLQLAPKEDLTSIAKFKNSLAYYYADTGRPEIEQRARQFAAEARKARPEESGPLDTEGYVKITYGKTRDEILSGISLCEQAWHQGQPLDAYVKHLTKANTRLQALSS